MAPITTTTEPTGPLLSITEAAKILGVSRTTAYTWANAGRLPVIRYGERGARVPRGALDAYMRQLDERALAAVEDGR
jgi:excisionase family DNA binding protein